MNQFLYSEITVLKFITKQYNYEILPSSEIEIRRSQRQTECLVFLVSKQAEKNFLSDFFGNFIRRITASFEPEIGII